MTEQNVMTFEIPIYDVSSMDIQVEVVQLENTNKKRGRPSTASSFAHVGPKIDKKNVSPGKLKIMQRSRHRQLQNASAKRFRDRQKLEQGKIEMEFIHESNRNNELKSKINQIENDIDQIRIDLLDHHPDIDFTEIFMKKYKEDVNFDIGLLVKETKAKCCEPNNETPGNHNLDALSIATNDIYDTQNDECTDDNSVNDTTVPGIQSYDSLSLWDLLKD